MIPDLIRAPPGSVAVVAAHPDDETIGLGGQLTHLAGITVLTVTDGAPRNLTDAQAAGCPTRADYARLRRAELEAAMSEAGIAPDRLACLDVVDQEASHDLAGLARRLAAWLEGRGIALVLTHPYEGGHPDHDATAFAAHAASALLARSGRRPPRLVEFTSYHARGDRMATAEFLPGGPDAVTCILDPATRGRKERMLSRFASQRATLAPFGSEVERFRPVPSYDFTLPPHDGLIWYDRFDWGMRGAQWRGLASSALRDLGLERC